MRLLSGLFLFLILSCGCASTRFLHQPFLDNQVSSEINEYLGDWEGINLFDKTEVQAHISMVTDEDGDPVKPPMLLAEITIKSDDRSEKFIPVVIQAFTLGGERFLAARAQLENERFWQKCGYGVSAIFLLRAYYYIMQSAPFEQDLIIRLVSFFPTEGDNRNQPLQENIKTAEDDKKLVLNNTVDIQKTLWEKKYELENFLQLRKVKAK